MFRIGVCSFGLGGVFGVRKDAFDQDGLGVRSLDPQAIPAKP